MKSIWIALCPAVCAGAAEDAKVTPLLTQDLTGIAGKEAMMVAVEYAPGAVKGHENPVSRC